MALIVLADLDYKDYAPGIMIVAPIHNEAQNFGNTGFMPRPSFGPK